MSGRRPNKPAKPIPPVAAACLAALERLPPNALPRGLFAPLDARQALAVQRVAQAFADGDNVVLDSFAPAVVAGVLRRWLLALRAPLVPQRHRALFLRVDALTYARRPLLLLLFAFVIAFFAFFFRSLLAAALQLPLPRPIFFQTQCLCVCVCACVVYFC